MTRDDLWKLVSWSPPASVDDRRIIWEAPINVYVADWRNFDLANVEKPLGNHYHKNGSPCDVAGLGECSVSEVFWIVKGQVKKLVLQDVRTNELQGMTSFFSERAGRVTDLVAGTLIYIPAFVAHAFLMAPGTVMGGVGTTTFDKEDLHMWPLIGPPQMPAIKG
ncbi:MAG: hypothetical protein Q7R85_03565 [bacterium]|nr:hypothetical protein [bacterium]